MSNVWGKVGAWAEEAERAEAEEKAQQVSASADLQSYPSLKEAVAAKGKKKKTTMSLSEFTAASSFGHGSGSNRDAVGVQSKSLTVDEMLRLPTGPRQRSQEDELHHGRLGGGFRSYNRSGQGSWGDGAGGGRRSYEDRRNSPPRGSDYGQTSRADDVDNWGSTKKSFNSSMAEPSRYRGDGGHKSYGGFRDDSRSSPPRFSDSGQISRSDEVDNWFSMKKPVSFDSMPISSKSKADEVDSWVTEKKQISSTNFQSKTIHQETNRWSQGRWHNGEKPLPEMVNEQNEPPLMPTKQRTNPFGAARPREEILAQKGLDWRKLDSEIESRTSRPTSSQSSRPSSSQSNQTESATVRVLEVPSRPRPKVNPFGDAKPREVLLEERGKDWKKIDLELEHRAVQRPESEEEKLLKAEITHLKLEFEKFGVSTEEESTEKSTNNQTNISNQIARKEKELELLMHELDDKVRYSQKTGDRPNSGSLRVTGFTERPPSQSGISQDVRNTEFVDRPRSQGNADVWVRPGDDDRSFQWGKERGSLGRGSDRSKFGERW